MVRTHPLGSFYYYETANTFSRDYVSVNYWPNKEASGSKLQQMFEKVQQASTKAPKPSNGS